MEKEKQEMEKEKQEEKAKAELNSAYEDGYKYGYSFLGKRFTQKGQSRYCLSEAITYMYAAKKGSRRKYLFDSDFKYHADRLGGRFRIGCESGAGKAAIEFGNYE